jgi:hypothetical protein
MRRLLVSTFVVAAVLGVATPSSAIGAAPVHGEASGTGRLAIGTGGCIAEESFTATLRASVIGRATLTGTTCVTLPSFVSEIEITSPGGTLTAIGSGIAGDPVVTYTIVSGSRRFASASGTITFTVTTTDVFDCDPRIGVCLGRHLVAAINGSIILGRLP